MEEICHEHPRQIPFQKVIHIDVIFRFPLRPACFTNLTLLDSRMLNNQGEAGLFPGAIGEAIQGKFKESDHGKKPSCIRPRSGGEEPR